MSEEITVRGVVSRELYAAGSKSERVATLLTTESGARYLLRRVGADPYADPELDALAGRSIEADGRLHRDVLLVERYRLR